MSKEEKYEDERYCGNCEEYTLQICHDSGHERDSSNDWQECKKCGWTKSGWSDTWHPPIEIEKEKPE